MTPEKLCVFCKHWNFSGGGAGYSEMTPGFDASMDCDKRQPIGELQDMTTEDFRKSILTAEKCKHYEPPQ